MSREAFEADAAAYGFDLTRFECAAPEPWSEYKDEATGHRWAGWQAARAAALEEAASAAFNHFVDVCRERKVDQDFVRVWCSSDAIRALKEKR